MRGNHDEARKSLEQIRTEDPKAIVPRLMLARLMLAESQAEPAAKVLAEALAIAPQDAQLKLQVARLLAEFGRYDEAMRQAREATSIAPQSVEAWVETARLHLALDRSVPAREAADRAVAIDGDSVEAVSMLALLDLREKRGEQALQRARALAGRRPADARAALLEGDVLLALAQPREAAEAYARAFSLRDDLQVAAKQSAALRAAGLPNPEAPLQRWVAEHPQDPQGRAMLGEAYLLAGRHVQAIEQYERLASNPAAGYAVLNNLAWLYQQTGDERAEATARRAYDLAPDDPAVIDTYGWILVQNGKLTEGLAALERAATRAPDNPDIRFHHAYALVHAGQGPKARTILDEVLAAHPQFASRAEAVQLQQKLAGNVIVGAN